LKGVVILPFSSNPNYPPFLVTAVSIILWNPVPKPEYFYLFEFSLAGKTDQALYLSSFPYIYPRSFEQEMHFKPLVVKRPSLSVSYSTKLDCIMEFIFFSR
jgi:hypothetical protein